MPRKAGSGQKDSDGLTLDDRRLLQEIAATGSWSEAAKSMGLTNAQMNAKFRKPAFKEKYDELFGAEQVEITQRELVQVARLVGQTYEEILNAEKMVTVDIDCPHCGESTKVKVPVVDYATKRAAAADLAKMTNIWKDQKNLKIEQTNINIHALLSPAELIFYEKLKWGTPIPPNYYESISNKLVGSGLPVPENPVIEGSYRLVEEGDNAADDTVPVEQP